MRNSIDTYHFEQITEDLVYDHIFELYTERPPKVNQDLGFVDRSSERVTIGLPDSGIELYIKQSFSGASTGFFCWRSAQFFTDWAISCEKCPFYGFFKSRNNLSVVELGAGVGGVCASILGPLCKRYVATDQIELLKLLKENFLDNVTTRNYTSTTVPFEKSKKLIASSPSTIDFIEYDWEYLEDGKSNYEQLVGPQEKPDLIIACDTIYNDYLVPLFVGALKSLLNEDNAALISLQMRDENILTLFLETALEENLNVYNIPCQMLSKSLKKGFVVYYITVP